MNSFSTTPPKRLETRLAFGLAGWLLLCFSAASLGALVIGGRLGRR